MTSFFAQRPTRPYGPCDTFFMDIDDDAWHEQKAQERERARAQAAECQRELAVELSKVTSDVYYDDVLVRMEEMEMKTMPDVNSIDIQTEIQWFMRPYLMDFLVEAHSAFGLIPDTLYLAVNLLDRYCSRRVVYKRHYQLVGCAALLIASKYGDRKERVPQIKELRAMCCALYEEIMFTQMEWHLLQTLDWTIGHPTVDSFLQIALMENPYDREVEHVSWYIAELALFHKACVSVLPSDIARSALALARCILDRPAAQSSEWVDKYDPVLAHRLFIQLQNPSSVVLKKYESSHLSNASITVQIYVQRQNEVERERVRQLGPMTPTIEAGAWTSSTKHAGINPETPQKMPYSTVMNHGLYTPPITPDNAIVAYGNPYGRIAPMIPSTPTPSSSATPWTSLQTHVNVGHGAHSGPQQQQYVS